MTITEILQKVCVTSTDNGTSFVDTTRLNVIRNILSPSSYQEVYTGDLCFLFSKRPIEGQAIVLISSHIDSVYKQCFYADAGVMYKGTFDNSLTNAAVLWCMQHDVLGENVVVAFTGDEEKDSHGCHEVMRVLEEHGCTVKFVITTDVTEEGWDKACPFTLENDNHVDLMTAHRIIQSLDEWGTNYKFIHDAEPDESWDYADGHYACLSLCAPILGEMHGEEGVLARKESMPFYCKALNVIVRSVI